MKTETPTAPRVDEIKLHNLIELHSLVQWKVDLTSNKINEMKWTILS